MQRTCTMPGCGKMHRAKGYCSGHYNRLVTPREKRHPKVTVACAHCGQPCIKGRGRDKRYANLFCSLVCRDAQRAEQKELKRERDRLRLLPVLFVGTVRRPKPARLPVPPQPRSRLFVAGTCKHCGAAFVVQDWSNTAVHCSSRCSARANKQKQRARKKGAFVAPVYRARIFERDGWRCQLCRKKVKRDSVVPHPLAPVIDHIMPLAKGGTHEPANVQCAHYLCNSVKRDLMVTHQLALF